MLSINLLVQEKIEGSKTEAPEMAMLSLEITYNLIKWLCVLRCKQEGE